MVITNKTVLPTEEELTVQEIELSTASLKAASFFLGKTCETINNEFMLCKTEENDPRKCLNEGKLVTKCALKFFQELKKNCAAEFEDYAECIDRGGGQLSLNKCRKTQAVFDSCMLSKMGLERPHLGYFCEAKVHCTKRPKPEPEPPAVYPDALPTIPDMDKNPPPPAKYGSRFLWFT